MISSIFSYARGLPVDLDKMSNQVISPFLNWMFAFLPWSSKNSLYALDTRPLADIWFANILSDSVGCLFIFLIVSLNEQNFVKVHLIFSFFFSLVLLVSYLPLWFSWSIFTSNVGDLRSLPGLGRSSGEWKGYPLQYSSILAWRIP